jgi:CheY-like chemotaxis protein
MDNAVLLLLVEDEEMIVEVTQDALEEGGFSVLTALSGTEAIALLDARSADLTGLITDIRLGPGPDGWEVARHGRKLRPDLPVVYTTGDSGADWSAEGVPKSVVVQKPYAQAQIVSAIAGLLNTAD